MTTAPAHAAAGDTPPAAAGRVGWGLLWLPMTWRQRHAGLLSNAWCPPAGRPHCCPARPLSSVLLVIVVWDDGARTHGVVPPALPTHAEGLHCAVQDWP